VSFLSQVHAGKRQLQQQLLATDFPGKLQAMATGSSNCKILGEPQTTARAEGAVPPKLLQSHDQAVQSRGPFSAKSVVKLLQLLSRVHPRRPAAKRRKRHDVRPELTVVGCEMNDLITDWCADPRSNL
jgi:hypothetical protein